MLLNVVCGQQTQAPFPSLHAVCVLTGADKVFVTAFDECLIQHSYNPDMGPGPCSQNPTEYTQQVSEIFIHYTLH